MPFSFRLAPPLRLARVKRDGLRKELARAMRALNEAEADLRAAEALVRQIGAELLRRAAEGLAGVELPLFSAARDAARTRLPALGARRRRAADEEDRLRVELAQATREVSVLEKLRREAFAAWRREVQRQEQAMIDDVVLVRRTRAMAAGERR